MLDFIQNFIQFLLRPSEIPTILCAVLVSVFFSVGRLVERGEK